jgi:hypothetical protein
MSSLCSLSLPFAVAFSSLCVLDLALIHLESVQLFHMDLQAVIAAVGERFISC